MRARVAWVKTPARRSETNEVRLWKARQWAGKVSFHLSRLDLGPCGKDWTLMPERGGASWDGGGGATLRGSPSRLSFLSTGWALWGEFSLT